MSLKGRSQPGFIGTPALHYKNMQSEQDFVIVVKVLEKTFPSGSIVAGGTMERD